MSGNSQRESMASASASATSYSYSCRARPIRPLLTVSHARDWLLRTLTLQAALRLRYPSLSHSPGPALSRHWFDRTRNLRSISVVMSFSGHGSVVDPPLLAWEAVADGTALRGIRREPR